MFLISGKEKSSNDNAGHAELKKVAMFAYRLPITVRSLIILPACELPNMKPFLE